MPHSDRDISRTGIAKQTMRLTFADYLSEESETWRKTIDVAAKLFRTYGFAEVSMTEIARGVGLSKPGLYHHWPSKDELLLTIVRFAGEILLAHLESVLESETDPVARLRAYVTSRLHTVAQYQDFFTVMWQERTTVGAGGFKEMSKRAEVYRSRVRDLIEDAKAAGGLKAEVDTHLLMLALDGITGWAYFWYRPEGGQTPSAIGDAFWQMLSGGILTRPPD